MDVYAAIHQRRSHRFYRAEMPPRKSLERIIEAAMWAPSGANLQGWAITVMAGQVRDDFVALISQAVKYLMPRLKQANYPEEAQKQVMQFFKNLGGAPVVAAVTIFKAADEYANRSLIQSGAALMQNLLLAAAGRGPGHLLDGRGQLSGGRHPEVPGERRPANPGHNPHRLPGQGTAGAAPQRARGALAGV